MFNIVLFVLIGFFLLPAYGDSKTISGNYEQVTDNIVYLDNKLFFISRPFEAETEPNITLSLHGVNFTIPYIPNPPPPGGIRSTSILFSDGNIEKLSRGMSPTIQTTLSSHIDPIAGFSRHPDNKFYFLVSVDSEAPLKQLKFNVPLSDIQCRAAFTLLLKSSDNSPICVTPETKEILIERGWAKPI